MKKTNAIVKRLLSVLLALALVLGMVPAMNAEKAEAASAGEVLYLVPNSNWTSSGARFAAYFFGDGDTWIDMTDSNEDGIYEVVIPADKNYTTVIFCRMNPATTANNWNNKWNQTGDLVLANSGSNNMYTIDNGQWDSGQNGTWSVCALYLRGSFNGWGADEAMTLNEDGSWTIEKDLDAGEYTYKVATSDWNLGYPDQNATLTVEKAGTYVFTLKDGNISVELKAEPVEPITITDNLRTLSLEDEVFINQYVAITGGNLTSEYIAANGGLLVWNGTVADEDAVYANAEVVKAGLNVSGEEYTQRTDGIVAKKYADVLTLRVYLKLEDGTYLYGDKVEYSVRDYCEAQIANASDAADVCAALLHYGAAAQVVFNYNTEDPANKNILESNPAAEWDASLLTAVVEPTTSIAATGDVKDRGKTLSLESAMAINYYFGVKNFEVGTDADSACLIVWDGVEGELTEANASAKIAMVVNPNMTDVVEYTAQVGDISAKEYGNTIYVCARFVDTEGNVHYSDVIAYSPEAYAAGRIENSQNANLIDVVKKMVVYGEEAAEYFANKQQ